MSYVGKADKEVAEGVWKEMATNQALREGRELYDWQYILDPDPEVFKEGEARISFLTKPFEGGNNA